MFALYLFALVVGGALLLFSLVGGSDHGDADFSHDGGHSPAQWLSIRTLMYFLFVFGGVGAILSRTWSPAAAPVVLGIAVLAGAGVGAAVSAAFGYLRRTDSGYRETDDSFIGLTARVTVPLGDGRTGKILGQDSREPRWSHLRPARPAVRPGGWRATAVRLERGHHRRNVTGHRDRGARG
jgi:hypothetical protein